MHAIERPASKTGLKAKKRKSCCNKIARVINGLFLSHRACYVSCQTRIKLVFLKTNSSVRLEKHETLSGKEKCQLGSVLMAQWGIETVARGSAGAATVESTRKSEDRARSYVVFKRHPLTPGPPKAAGPRKPTKSSPALASEGAKRWCFLHDMLTPCAWLSGKTLDVKFPPAMTHQQLAVGDMTMSGWKPTISLIHPPTHQPCGMCMRKTCG